MVLAASRRRLADRLAASRRNLQCFVKNSDRGKRAIDLRLQTIAFGVVWLVTDLIYSLSVRRLAASSAYEVARAPLGRALGVVSGMARGAIVSMLLIAIVAALPLPEPIGKSIFDSYLGSRLAMRGESVQRALATS